MANRVSDPGRHSFVVVSSENENNWHWYLEIMSSILEPGRNVTFVSDRNAGLVEALGKVFPEAAHGYCLQHLKGNLRHHFCGYLHGSREEVVGLFIKCAYALTEELFHSCLNELVEVGGLRVEIFLKDILYEHWCNAYFQGHHFGEMSSNASESFSSWIREESHLPVMKLVDTIRLKLMRQMAFRRAIVCKWNGVICPVMDSKLNKAFNVSRPWIVSSSRVDVYEVHSFPSVSVDIGRRTCSCFKWQVNDFPCEHAIAVIQKSGHDLNSYVDQYYYVASYRESYSNSIYHIPSIWKPNSVDGDGVVLPPMSKKRLGRPKKNRIPSKGEKVKQIRCGWCGKLGHHNKKSCKDAL